MNLVKQLRFNLSLGVKVWAFTDQVMRYNGVKWLP
jgi:hypothetical protein